MPSYREILEALSSQGRLRKLRTLSKGGCRLEIGGRSYINLSSNDYLSLSHDDRVKKRAADAIYHSGTSASASRLVTGDLEIHALLEREIADYLNREACLVFGSGYLANLGVLTALAGRDDCIFSDRLNHASLVDGALQSRATVVRYRHNDLADLQRLVDKDRSDGQKFIVTESVFSMDGDIAPLSELARLADRIDATLIVDEAHAIGVFGAGALSSLSIPPKKLVILGTLSKSLGSYGGFVACSLEMREYLINKARSFIYSTSLPPTCCSAALEALRIIRTEKSLGAKLLKKGSSLHEALVGLGERLTPFHSPIIPIIVGDDKQCLALAESLFERGILCTPIRPPTVPENTARLRLSVNLAHTEEDLRFVAEEMTRLVQE